jgi:hypothetical protein
LAAQFGGYSAGVVEDATDLSRWLNQVKTTAMAQAAEDNGGTVDTGFQVRFDSLLQEMETRWYTNQGMANPRATYDAGFRTALANTAAGEVVRWGQEVENVDGTLYLKDTARAPMFVELENLLFDDAPGRPWSEQITGDVTPLTDYEIAHGFTGGADVTGGAGGGGGGVQISTGTVIMLAVLAVIVWYANRQGWF